MEEKMALAEEKQNESELEDMKAFLGMRKYYRKDIQATTPSNSSLYNSCQKEFKILLNNKTTLIEKNKQCTCAAASPAWEENPTRDMDHTFQCGRTGTPNRGFGRPNKPKYTANKLKNAINDPTKHFKLFTDTIANDCHLRKSAPIPDGGDCGLSAYSVLLRNDTEHLANVNALRQTIGHSKLEATDWNTYLRRLLAMTTTEKSLIFKDLFKESKLFRDLRSDIQSDLNHQIQIVQNNKFWVKSKEGKYESVDAAHLNHVYNQLVARFISFSVLI